MNKEDIKNEINEIEQEIDDIEKYNAGIDSKSAKVEKDIESLTRRIIEREAVIKKRNKEISYKAEEAGEGKLKALEQKFKAAEAEVKNHKNDLRLITEVVPSPSDYKNWIDRATDNEVDRLDALDKNEVEKLLQLAEKKKTDFSAEIAEVKKGLEVVNGLRGELSKQKEQQEADIKTLEVKKEQLAEFQSNRDKKPREKRAKEDRLVKLIGEFLREASYGTSFYDKRMEQAVNAAMFAELSGNRGLSSMLGQSIELMALNSITKSMNITSLLTSFNTMERTLNSIDELQKLTGEDSGDERKQILDKMRGLINSVD